MLKVGIICASDDELAPFLPEIEDCSTSETAMLTFYSGRVRDIETVALYSGVCKVNAAIAAQILIDKYDVTTIINAGTAGGMDETLQIFDTVISTQAVYHDVAEDILTEFHPWLSSVYFDADETLLRAAKRAAKDQPDIYFGVMATGEPFIVDDQREAILKAFSPLSVDMETASIAHVCYVNRIPFIAVRTVTDTAAHAGAAHFEQNCKQASARSRDVVLALLSEIKK